MFVMERGILGVNSRDDGGVQGTRHCDCGAELRGSRSAKEVQIGSELGGAGIPGVSRTDGEVFRQCRPEHR